MIDYSPVMIKKMEEIQTRNGRGLQDDEREEYLSNLVDEFGETIAEQSRKIDRLEVAIILLAKEVDLQVRKLKNK